jgi:hypothetical protein
MAVVGKEGLEQRIADAKRADLVARKKPFDKIKAGLNDALAHAQGRTLFEQCVEAVREAVSGNMMHDGGELDAAAPLITRAVLQTLADNSPSPRTVDEVIRVLREAE